MSYDRQVLVGMTRSYPTVILVEGYIQHPVQAFSMLRCFWRRSAGWARLPDSCKCGSGHLLGNQHQRYVGS